MLVWIVIPLLLIGIVGIQESFADEKIWLLSEFVDNPKQQMKNGILPSEVRCNVGLVLIFKSSNNLPACVKPPTAERLIERGWAILEKPPEVNQLEQNIQN